MKELELEDPAAFKNFMQMEPAMFQEILQRITPRIEKQDTFWRKALEPGVKLAITIRFLATGDSYKSLMYNVRVHASTICKFIQPVCEAIIAEYSGKLVSCPTTPEAWLQVAQGFESKWNLPHCIGAIDGKHIAMKCPKNGGSLFYNYKGFHSIVLMALVDADYKFLALDVGASGSGSDGGIIEGTDLKRCMEDGSIGLPPPSPLPGGDRPVGYYIVGDDAFQLKTWLMKPVPSRNLTIEDRIYNYRLSRARRVVENAFGLLSSR
ncbi:protein ALP1-like [Thalassophryne amazonica]|uniref:protein ALP1-like n=1 Tax=Thalassophryne amazonica TaxID=390379 RepID=UPI001471F797|nr:protein ALP1-like [Thalassophryne amazonica]